MGGAEERRQRADLLLWAIIDMRLRVQVMSVARARVRGMQPKPSIGRIVHFNHSDGSKRAAIITSVSNDECVNLTVFAPSGSPYNETSVLLGGDPGRWQWPEKV